MIVSQPTIGNFLLHMQQVGSSTSYNSDSPLDSILGSQALTVQFNFNLNTLFSIHLFYFKTITAVASLIYKINVCHLLSTTGRRTKH